MTREPPSTDQRPANHLRDAATRLTADLSEARLYQAAAYVAMAVEAMDTSVPAALNDNRPRTDVECEFELDEHGRVWMIREGGCHMIGRKDAVRAEMWRFLRVLLPGLG